MSHESTVTLFFSCSEYEYYNCGTPTGEAFAWDSYFTEKPAGFDEILTSDTGIVLEWGVEVEVPLSILSAYQRGDDAAAAQLIDLLAPACFKIMGAVE